MENKIIKGRYWNSNGFAVAIIANITPGINWAAYIGGTDLVEHEADAIDWVNRYGCKLSEKDARHFFSNIELSYRR